MSSRSSAGGENKTKSSKRNVFIVLASQKKKKFIQKSYSHSWEYRLITVDVWWALGGTNIVCSQVSWVRLGGVLSEIIISKPANGKDKKFHLPETQTHPFSYKTDVSKAQFQPWGGLIFFSPFFLSCAFFCTSM